jgi:D-alanyl-D-alanine carboxypeptidase/D-alanyl-D-alanine-endopeptidase (penicillin-binding protein 4)
VRGLIVDQREVRDTAVDAARRFATLLGARGITVTSVGRDRYAEVGGQLASVSGWTVASIVRRMLRVSDNDDAEYLARQVALAEGFRPQWDGARAAVRQVLAEHVAQLADVTFTVYDGSGLSRSNRISPQALVALLDHVEQTPQLAKVFYHATGMPVSGVSGTLGPDYKRYVTAPTKCAKGRVAAKTGSLRGVIALAGRTKDADGAVKTFAFLVSGEPADLTTRRAVDKLASTITGCW